MFEEGVELDVGHGIETGIAIEVPIGAVAGMTIIPALAVSRAVGGPSPLSQASGDNKDGRACRKPLNRCRTGDLPPYLRARRGFGVAFHAAERV